MPMPVPNPMATLAAPMDADPFSSPTMTRSVKHTGPSSSSSPESPSSVLQFPVVPQIARQQEQQRRLQLQLRSAVAQGTINSNIVVERRHSGIIPLLRNTVPGPPPGTPTIPGAPRVSRRKSVPVRFPANENDNDRNSNRNSNSNSNRNKSVRFTPFPTVKDTLSRHDMSLSERKEYWIQCHELMVIKKRNRALIRVAAAATTTTMDHPHKPDNSVLVNVATSSGLCLPGLVADEEDRGSSDSIYECDMIDDAFAEVYYEDTNNNDNITTSTNCGS